MKKPAGANQQRSIQVFDSPITRKQTYTSIPRPVQCARCNNVAHCKMMYDLGPVIKVEYLCKSCGNEAI
jgi:hypothetical protein